MHERERRSSVELLPVTRQLLAQVERETGRPVVIRPEPRVATRGRAVYAVSDRNPERHLVLYDPAQERFLDHLAAHECGHILQLAQARPEERTVAVLTDGTRRRAVTQVLPDLVRLTQRGISADSVQAAVPIWLGGTIAQLADTPPDIRIERWLHAEWPGLREVQRRSLAEQAAQLHRVLERPVRALTPSIIWVASNAMNYALLKSAAGLLGEPSLIRPYRHTGTDSLGEELLGLLSARSSVSLAEDRAVSEDWASQLNLSGWLEWRRLDDLHVGTPAFWE